MSDDTTRDPGGSPPAPEAGEQQLRKALATMNDLQPPRDDLFAQRALQRGRAMTSRRRSQVLGAAAVVVVAGAVGGTWVATQGDPSSMTAGSAVAEAAKGAQGTPPPDAGTGSTDDNEAVDSGGGGARQPGTTDGRGPLVAPSVPPARDLSRWFGALSTPQTTAFTAAAPTVVSRWGDVFSGAYAAEPSGARVTVAVTRHDAALEAFVRQAMPSPDDVDFVIATHSLADKQRVANEVVDERMLWRSKGIQVVGAMVDTRLDVVDVLVDGDDPQGLLAQRYGSIVRVVPGTPGNPGKLPDGSTVPPPQR
ncbi:hypothetical protein GCM10023258_09140 [Terrabacter aeriphilus]|uniref:Uncharacterized protein n=1 Tax=Terrabacter aeriphilus TaxID=515662 RepID=A0ABP9J4Q8_9MICO